MSANYGMNWTPMNNYGPWTWQPNTQYPSPSQLPPSNAYGYSQDRGRQPVNNLLRVTGPESAKAYSLPPNSSVVLFDADNPIFYLKSTDDSGFATLRTFEFSEKPPEVLDVAAEPAGAGKDDELKKEVEGLKSDISDLKEMLEGLVR